MICIASTRTSLATWLESRGYFLGTSFPYPKIPGHKLLDDTISLNAYLKELQTKGPKERGPKESGHINNSVPISATAKNRMHLSPIWRMEQTKSGPDIPGVD
jgi:hypothetical protein